MMKKTMILLLQILIPLSVAMILNILTGVFITPLAGVDLSTVPDLDRTMKGLFTVHLIQVLILTLIAARSRLDGIKLGILLALLSFSINHVLNTMESLVFMQKIYPLSLQFVQLLNGLISSLGVGFTIAFLTGPGEKEFDEYPEFQWSSKLLLPWTSWVLIWFIIYFCAGYLIPMNVEGVSEYYFSPDGAMDLSMVPIGYILQIPRASIWILLAIGLYKYLNGSDWEKCLMTGLVFGGLMSSDLLIPNYLMPGFVRMAHLAEIIYANLLWGIIISYKVRKHFLSRKIPGKGIDLHIPTL